MSDPIVPSDWDDSTIITIDEFSDLLGVPVEERERWATGGSGPRWRRFQGVGRSYVTAAEARRYLAAVPKPTWGDGDAR